MVIAMLLAAHVVGIWLGMAAVLVLWTRALLPHRRSVVVCPKRRLPALIDVDGHLAIETCSRLGTTQDCTHDCLPQLQFAVEGVGSLLDAQKCCKICGGILSGKDWYASRLAATRASNAQWASSESGQGICWSCFEARSA